MCPTGTPLQGSNTQAVQMVFGLTESHKSRKNLSVPWLLSFISCTPSLVTLIWHGNHAMVDVDPEGSIKLIILNTSFLLLAVTVFGLRIVGRRFKRTKLKGSDGLLFVALIFQIGQSIVNNFSM